jgi:hypothetical protein
VAEEPEQDVPVRQHRHRDEDRQLPVIHFPPPTWTRPTSGV